MQNSRLMNGALLIALASLAAMATVSRASTPGTDNASNYGGGWTDGSNGGTGFGAWNLAGNNNDGTANFAGYFIGDATANTSGIGNINTSGNSFGMYANPNGAFANADRAFAGGALSTGQTFSLQLATSFRNGGKGLNLYAGGAAGTQIINFNIGNVGGVDGYYYQVGAGAATDTGFAYAADSVFTLGYTQQSATAGLFSISRTSAGTPAANGVVTVPLTTSGVDSFRVYNSNATNSSSDNLFFNNLSIAPEPSSTATMVIAGLLLVGVVFRRRTSSVV